MILSHNLISYYIQQYFIKFTNHIYLLLLFLLTNISNLINLLLEIGFLKLHY